MAAKRQTKTKVLRVGIVGAGTAGGVHWGVYDKHPATKVVALADPRGKAVLKQAGADYMPGSTTRRAAKLPVYASLSALLDAADVDVIDICAPTTFHCDLAVEALRADKHVLCEKPMGRTLADCDAILDAVRASKSKFMVAHCLRFWPVYEYLHEVVTSGQYGRVELARLWRRVIVPAGGWFLDGRISGGAILDLHIHDVDAALWIFGAPAAMTAFGRKGPSGGYDQVEAIWHYGDDRLVVLEGLWFKSAPSAFEMGFEVAMEKATVTYSTARKPDLQVSIPGQEPIIPKLSEQEGYYREIDYFIRAILDDRPIKRAAPESSRLSVAMVESEIASIESRGRIATRPSKITR